MFKPLRSSAAQRMLKGQVGLSRRRIAVAWLSPVERRASIDWLVSGGFEAPPASA
jgi:hypothetical protein